MEEKSKQLFDPSKITGFYPLAGAFLLVAETLLSIWLFRAEDSIERIVAGSLMTFLLLGFIFLLYSINRSGSKIPAEFVIEAKGIGEITPAKESATEKEVKSPEAQQISGPDSSYLVNKPPDNWITQVLPYEEFVAGNLSISAKSFDPNIIESIKESYSGDVLYFHSQNEYSVIPIPGRTLIEKRKIPSALEVTVFPRLSVITLSRFSPPFWYERPFLHNILSQVCKTLGMEVFTLRKITEQLQAGSNRKFFSVELVQEIENCIVNGNEIKGITTNATLIGIQGETHDYLISMQYPIITGETIPALEEDLKVLQSLASSFKPLQVINKEQKIRESRLKADKEFEDVLAEKSQNIFFSEFAILMMRLLTFNLSDIVQISRAKDLLKPFRLAAANAKIDDEKLNKLWEVLDEADSGRYDKFTDELKDFLKIFEEGMKNRNDVQAGGTGQ